MANSIINCATESSVGYSAGIVIDSTNALVQSNITANNSTYGIRALKEGSEITYNDSYGNLENFNGFSPDTSNISENPLFVTGPKGNFYLSQILAGQTEESPCVNRGPAPASDYGLDIRTTRTDGVNDDGTVDMGYHYKIK